MSYKLRSRIVKCPSNRDCCDVNEKPDQNFDQEIFSLKGRGKVILGGKTAVQSNLEWIAAVDLLLSIEHLLNQLRVGWIALKDHAVQDQI